MEIMKGIKVVLQEGYVKISYSNNGTRKRFPTGVKIENANQISPNGKLKGNIEDKKNKQEQISNLQFKIQSIIRQYNLENGENPSVFELEKILLDNSRQIQKTERVLDAYDIYYKKKKSEFLKNTARSKDSIKEYRGLHYYLMDYEVFLGRDIRFLDINKDWMLDFKVFNETPRKSDKTKKYITKGGLRGNTIKKKMNLFITFMKWASTKPQSYCSFPSDIDKFSNQIKSPEVIKSALTKDEIFKINSFKTKSTSHEIVRDIFVFSCLTGMRWSDIIGLEKVHFKKNKQGEYILKKAEKTDTEFMVYLNNISSNILKKYNYNLNLISNPVFNKKLKEFLKATNLFNEETKFKEGGRSLLRWETISIHRGRDTFITMLIEENVPLSTIMRYTGHKHLSTLEKYIDLNKKVDNFIAPIFKNLTSE